MISSRRTPESLLQTKNNLHPLHSQWCQQVTNCPNMSVQYLHHARPLSYFSQLAGIAWSVQRLATGWTVRVSNLCGGEIFRTRPDRPWGPPGLLYNGYGFSFPGAKRSGSDVDYPPPSSAEVKERVELYLYSPSEVSWPVLGRTLPLLRFA